MIYIINSHENGQINFLFICDSDITKRSIDSFGSFHFQFAFTLVGTPSNPTSNLNSKFEKEIIVIIWIDNWKKKIIIWIIIITMNIQSLLFF